MSANKFLIVVVGSSIALTACSSPENRKIPVASTTTTAKPLTTTTEIYYAKCADAPGVLYRGGPGYRSGLDRDGDGVACEPN